VNGWYTNTLTRKCPKVGVVEESTKKVCPIGIQAQNFSQFFHGYVLLVDKLCHLCFKMCYIKLDA
jgi:hypothetical protein